MIKWIKNSIKFFLLRKKFSDSVIYLGTSIDRNSQLGKKSVVFANTILINSVLDDYSYIQKNSEIINTKIGKFCSIASDVKINLANHPVSLVSTHPAFYDKVQPLPKFFTSKQMRKEEIISRTIIQSDVWIGQGVMIKPSITIGVGAVIGAGAVVTKDVEPYSIVVGVPARHIKYRFEKDIREKLLASKWWELSEEKLEKLAPYFDDPEILLNELNKIVDQFSNEIIQKSNPIKK